MSDQVLVAMSGGVDSSVAAALAVEAGWDVTGVHLKLADTPGHLQVQGKGCCTLADAEDARRVADTLGIPFYVWDMAEEFQRAVVDDFAAEYAGGRTPNPCARCNERVKVVGLLARARA
ncbi:MAG TPA: tRNA 2-thiouridine(34) synthase MnmA, partial [Actinomycetota bacterium]|nr:tRNA 2-thiouridine(34) synthase MnmA [Actinomycetota bacterium]